VSIAPRHQVPAGVVVVEGRPNLSAVQDLAVLAVVRHLPDPRLHSAGPRVVRDYLE
jgi:hypothetical protein